MSVVYTEITLKNAIDAGNARQSIISEQEIRQMTVQALVDSGAWTLVINEDTREKLGLEIVDSDLGTLADGTKGIYDVAGPIEVIWKNRRTICVALVLPDADEVLLGAIPLEALDLMIHPRLEEVVGAHGDQVIHRV